MFCQLLSPTVLRILLSYFLLLHKSISSVASKMTKPEFQGSKTMDHRNASGFLKSDAPIFVW